MQATKKTKMKQILFYVKDNSDKSVWAIDSYDKNVSNRLGWLNGKCVDVGTNHKIYIGCDFGIDAERVFTNDQYDVSKHNSFTN